MPATPIDFKEVWPKLKAYTDSTGMPFAECARRAVSAFIDSELAKNPGVKEQFDAYWSRQREHGGSNVESIVERRRRGRPRTRGA